MSPLASDGGIGLRGLPESVEEQGKVVVEVKFLYLDLDEGGVEFEGFERVGWFALQSIFIFNYITRFIGMISTRVLCLRIQ